MKRSITLKQSQPNLPGIFLAALVAVALIVSQSQAASDGDAKSNRAPAKHNKAQASPKAAPAPAMSVTNRALTTNAMPALAAAMPAVPETNATTVPHERHDAALYDYPPVPLALLASSPGEEPRATNHTLAPETTPVNAPKLPEPPAEPAQNAVAAAQLNQPPGIGLDGLSNRIARVERTLAHYESNQPAASALPLAAAGVVPITPSELRQIELGQRELEQRMVAMEVARASDRGGLAALSEIVRSLVWPLWAVALLLLAGGCVALARRQNPRDWAPCPVYPRLTEPEGHSGRSGAEPAHSDHPWPGDSMEDAEPRLERPPATGKGATELKQAKVRRPVGLMAGSDSRMSQPACLPRFVMAGRLAPYITDYMDKFLARTSPYNEAGGVLVGRLRTGRDGRVFELVGFVEAGPEAVCGPASIDFDGQYQTDRLGALRLVDPQLQLLGAIHLHPGNLDCCSTTDHETDRKAVLESATKEMLFGIVTKTHWAPADPLSLYPAGGRYKLDFFYLGYASDYSYMKIKPELADDLPLLESHGGLVSFRRRYADRALSQLKAISDVAWAEHKIDAVTLAEQQLKDGTPGHLLTIGRDTDPFTIHIVDGNHRALEVYVKQQGKVYQVTRKDLEWHTHALHEAFALVRKINRQTN